MSDEKSTTTEIEQQRLKAGLVLKQAATICKANRDALVAVCKKKAPAVAGDDQRAGVLVEFMVQILNKYGHLLNPRISSGGRKGEEKLTKEEVRAMMHRSGRALRNAASICKSNRDMLVSSFKKQADEASDSVSVEAVVDAVAEVLDTYAVHLILDEDIEKFEMVDNPFWF